MAGDPCPGRYRHYKGRYYQLLGIARHSETLERLVIYQSLQDEDHLWARPLTMWQELVEVDGVLEPRFVFVGEKTDTK